MKGCYETLESVLFIAWSSSLMLGHEALAESFNNSGHIPHKFLQYRLAAEIKR